ncbi:uncharacterized protein BDZ99DRAFT_482059 [Mytilinidion resinicola]|uniref:Uncharacterized protein n=1 Tax=Mytilinidion resinicola TaxID=574789 RepID=A0A6A6Y4D4_9PEZI|nr:uncharacterized protein BDZ99DRAFT_482059 [Mytilinidion resinicola]KAF2803652.1 hypothetical protein BDZ99DRAFT_482059 [Mytilinidion resinicola]
MKYHIPSLRSQPGCFVPKLATSKVTFSDGLTFQRIILIVAAATTGATILITLFLTGLHIRYYTNPAEQRLIIRIIWIPAIFSIFGPACISSYTAAPYIEPFAKLCETIALASIFLLCVNFIVPDPLSASNTTIGDLCVEVGCRGNPSSLRDKLRRSKSSALWLKRAWIAVFQYPVIVFATTIATEVTIAILCPTSLAYSRARLVIRIVNAISTSAAITAIVNYSIRLKKSLEGRRVGPKLVCCKGLVILATLELVVFAAVDRVTLRDATPRLTYFDWIIGVPSIIICLEMVLFIISFIWAFPPSPYRRLGPSSSFRSRLIHAVADAVNLINIAKGIVMAFGSLKVARTTAADGMLQSGYVAAKTEDRTGDYGEL